MPKPELHIAELFAQISPALVISVIAGLASAIYSKEEVRFKKILNNLILSGFTGIVIVLFIFDSDKFTEMTKLGIICVGAFVSNTVLPCLDEVAKSFLKRIFPDLDFDNKKKKSNKNDDDDSDNRPRRPPKKYLEDIDEDKDDGNVNLDDDHENYCRLPDPDKKPKEKRTRSTISERSKPIKPNKNNGKKPTGEK